MREECVLLAYRAGHAGERAGQGRCLTGEAGPSQAGPWGLCPQREARPWTPSRERKGIMRGRLESSTSYLSSLGNSPPFSWPEQALDKYLVNE